MKVLGIVMTVAMLASFMVVGSPVSAVGGPLAANQSNNNFVNVNLPTTYAGYDVIILEVDGNTLYAGVWDTTDYWVVKSVDGGYNWTDTTLNKAWYAGIVAGSNPALGAIVDIVASPAGDGTVYVGFGGSNNLAVAIPGTTGVYKIANRGAGTVTQLSPIVSEGDVMASYLYDMDVFWDSVTRTAYVMVATDIDALVYDDTGIFHEWTPLQLIDKNGIDPVDPTDDYTGLGVVKAEFAPDFASSNVIWAICDTGDDNVGTFGGVLNTLALCSTTGTGTWNATFDEIIFDGADGPDNITNTTYM